MVATIVITLSASSFYPQPCSLGFSSVRFTVSETDTAKLRVCRISAKYYVRTQYPFFNSTVFIESSHIYFVIGTLVNLEMSTSRAVPLCLPNNYNWDEKSGVHSKDEDQSRTSLCVIDAALRKLRQIKGNEKTNN